MSYRCAGYTRSGRRCAQRVKTPNTACGRCIDPTGANISPLHKLAASLSPTGPLPTADPAATAAALATAAEQTDQARTNRTVWPWTTDPQMVRLSQHPDSSVRARFAGLVCADPEPGTMHDNRDNPQHVLSHSGIYTDPPTGGSAAVWMALHSDPDPFVRQTVVTARAAIHRAWAAVHPDKPCPGGTSVSKPNGTWTDLDLESMLDSNPWILGEWMLVISQMHHENPSAVDKLPADTVKAGLSGNWRKLGDSGAWYLQPGLCELSDSDAEHLLLTHPAEAVRKTILQNKSINLSTDALYRTCGDRSRKVRSTVLHRLARKKLYPVQRGHRVRLDADAVRTSPTNLHPAIAAIFREGEHNVEWRKLDWDDEWLAPHVGGPYWDTNPNLRRLAARITHNPDLITRLANDPSAQTTQILLDRASDGELALPAAVLLQWSTRHKSKGIRQQAAQRLAEL